MSDTQSPDRDHAAKEATKKAAARRESPRLAKRGYDPQMCRSFEAMDRGE